MSNKFVLIDAHSIIFRSYFAFINNPLKNSKGMNTSGVFGFLNTLEKIKKKLPTDYMLLAYDAPGETFRDKAFKEYKATRPATPPDLPFQIAKIKEISEYLGITQFELEGFEADDILATCATRFAKEGDVYIVSSDKDLLQLVSERIFVYDAYRDEVLGRAKVIEKFGLPPERIVDYLTLTGDASDNVPGVPGIGPKRALEIINKYHDLEEAINEDPRLISHKEQALLSRKLITLECAVPLKFQMKDLLVKKPDLDKLMPVLLDLEFHSYIKEYASKEKPLVISQALTDLLEIKLTGFVGISFDEQNCLYLSNNPKSVFAIDVEKAKGLLLNEDIIKIGYGFKHWLKKVAIASPIFDLEIIAWLLDPNRKSYSLQDMVLHDLHNFVEITSGGAANFCFQLYPTLSEQLMSYGEENLYHKIEEPLIFVLSKMEERGIKVDLSYLKNLGTEFQKDIGQAEKVIYEQAGREFNINSPKQLSQILFEELKLKPTKRGKTHYSTDVEVLEQLSTSHALPAMILKYRELSKIKSTYIDPLITLAKNSRIHTTFNQTGTATGRLSSSNPNIQNIPIRSEVGKKLRKAFIAEPGFVLISADYSQIELRLLAHITKDANLIQAFAQGDDIHRHTASLVFNIPEDKVDDKQRRMAKVVNYGLIYGMSEYGLAQGLDIPQEQAQQFIEGYYHLYPEVERWRSQAIARAEEKGYTETFFGRRRPLPDIYSNNRMLREFSKRAAINTPIQGTAADLIKLAMIEVEKKLGPDKFKSGLLLSIHDELLFEIEETRVRDAEALIKECMEHVIELVVPVLVSLGTGRNWADAH